MIWAWWSSLMHFFLWSRDIPDHIGHTEEAFLHVAGFREGWRWGPSGDGRKLQGEVLMGKRQMACQWQKWSCAGESAGANEREDGRKGWLINLFTSLKTLQAPFWLKFHLPSIIANARSSYWSCQHQMLDPPSPTLALSGLSSHHTSENWAKHFELGFHPHMHLYLLFLLCCWVSGSLEKCSCTVSPEVCSSVTL